MDLSGVHMTFECSFSLPRFVRRGVWSGIVRYWDGISTLFSARFYITRCICIQSRGSIMHVILMLHLASYVMEQSIVTIITTFLCV